MDKFWREDHDNFSSRLMEEDVGQEVILPEDIMPDFGKLAVDESDEADGGGR